MREWMDKLKEFLQNLVPVAIIGGLVFGGYHLYKQGTFRNGVRPAVTSIVKKIPYFGSKFGHYMTPQTSSTRSSYVASTRHKSVSKKHKKSRVKSLAKRGHSKKQSRRHRR